MPCVPFRIFFFNDTATTEIYTLSLHDALPIWPGAGESIRPPPPKPRTSFFYCNTAIELGVFPTRSEEHTSELQSHLNLVCRLLLEKKKKELMHFTEPAVSTRALSLTRHTYDAV